MTVKYRVWEVENPPNDPNYFPAKDIEDALRIIKKEIKNNRIWSVWGDAFGLEADDGTGWAEWYNDNGKDIMEVYDLREM